MFWNYAAYEYYLSALLLVCAMFGMGTSLTVRDFIGIVRAPQGVVLVLLLQVVITPFLALGLAHLLSLPPGIAVGLLLVSALPGGLFSNVLSFLGRGNVALSVTATAICTLLCLMTTSLVLKMHGSAQLPDDFSMPVTRILTEIAFCLLLPLSVGMVVRRLAPAHYPRIAQWCVRASLLMLLLMAVGALSSGRLDLFGFGWRAPLALILFGIGSVWLSYGLGFLIRLPVADTYTVGVEVVVRNAHLGVLLKASLFPAVADVADPVADGVLYVVLLYGVASLLIAGVETVGHRKQAGLIFGRGTTKPARDPLLADRRRASQGS